MISGCGSGVDPPQAASSTAAANVAMRKCGPPMKNRHGRLPEWIAKSGAAVGRRRVDTKADRRIMGVDQLAAAAQGASEVGLGGGVAERVAGLAAFEAVHRR